MHYDPTTTIDLQIIDRLRDLLESDPVVSDVYGREILCLQSDDVPESEGSRIAIVLGTEDLAIAATATHNRDPGLVLIVQQFAGIDGQDNQVRAFRACIALTNHLQDALMRYQSDPTEGVPSRLWDSFAWQKNTTHYQKFPGKYFYSLSYFNLNSYQRTL